MNNKKGIIILISTGVILLLGSLCTTFYAVHKMNKVEDILVFSTETTNVPETTITTNAETTTTTTTIVTDTIVTDEVTTPGEVLVETEVTETLAVIEAVPDNSGGMTRGEWYEKNGHAGAPEEQEPEYDHDEYMYIKNNNTYMGEFNVKVEPVEHGIIYDDNISEGDAVAGVDTGLNIGDKIYVAGCGYFTIVNLTDSAIFEKDERIICFATELLYDSNGVILLYFYTEVYLIE